LNLKKKKILALVIPALTVIVVDQVSKYLIRTTSWLQNYTLIDGWLAFHYTQNPGMALGLDWLSTPVISLVAMLAVAIITFYIYSNFDKANAFYMVCMGLVLGGAIGNIIDRLIMARLESYGGILEGHVVDFIHFTPEVFNYPVFPYIFNVADTAISVAIILLILFNKQILPVEESADEEVEEEAEILTQDVKDKSQTKSAFGNPPDAEEKG